MRIPPRQAVFALIALITLAIPVAAKSAVYFVVGEFPGEEVYYDSYVLPLDSPDDIQHARDLILYGPEFGDPLIVAKIAAGADGINRDYLAAGARPNGPGTSRNSARSPSRQSKYLMAGRVTSKTTSMAGYRTPTDTLGSGATPSSTSFPQSPNPRPSRSSSPPPPSFSSTPAARRPDREAPRPYAKTRSTQNEQRATPNRSVCQLAPMQAASSYVRFVVSANKPSFPLSQSPQSRKAATW